MTSSIKLTLITILAIIAVAVLITVVLRPGARTFSPEVLDRSDHYIETLGVEPISSLNTEQKLLLLHAYYNTHNYIKVREIADVLGDELNRLSLFRRSAFQEMIAEAQKRK